MEMSGLSAIGSRQSAIGNMPGQQTFRSFHRLAGITCFVLKLFMQQLKSNELNKSAQPRRGLPIHD
jgi:hypothetical protein